MEKAGVHWEDLPGHLRASARQSKEVMTTAVYQIYPVELAEDVRAYEVLQLLTALFWWKERGERKERIG